MTETLTTTPATVPAARQAAPARQARRERPMSQFWDAEECCWQAAPESGAVSPGVPGAG